MESNRASLGDLWGAFWNRGQWWKAVTFVVAYLAIYLFAGRVIGPLFGKVDGNALLSSPFDLLVGVVWPLLAGAVVLVAFVASLRWFPVLFAKQPVTGRWWMWIFVAFAIIPVVLRLVGIDYGLYGAGVLASAVLMGVGVGFTEELVFRGIVVKLLRDAGHKELTVAVGSSLLFALSHSVNALSGQKLVAVAFTVLYTFCFGILMYLAMRVTGSLLFAMVLHGFTDPTTFLSVGGIDTGSVDSSNALLTLAAPFNLLIIVAGLVALFFIRGKAPLARRATEEVAPS